MLAMVSHNGGMQNLRRIREARGLSQTHLADMVGCSQSTISKLEKGGKNVTLDMLELIAEALHTTPVALIGLPAAEQRALEALGQMDEARRAAALVVLEAMSREARSS